MRAGAMWSFRWSVVPLQTTSLRVALLSAEFSATRALVRRALRTAVLPSRDDAITAGLVCPAETDVRAEFGNELHRGTLATSLYVCPFVGRRAAEHAPAINFSRFSPPNASVWNWWKKLDRIVH